jgi:hypothetical protein
MDPHPHLKECPLISLSPSWEELVAIPELRSQVPQLLQKGRGTQGGEAGHRVQIGL